MASKKCGVDSIVNGERSPNMTHVRGDFVRFKVWNALIQVDMPVDAQFLADVSGCSYYQCKTWLDVWHDANLLSKTELDRSPTGGKRFEFALTQKSTRPPLIDIKGQPKPVEHRQYIWDAIFEIGFNDKYFTVKEVIDFIKIHNNVEVSHEYATSYLRCLFNARYLWSLLAHTPYSIYTLRHYTGILAPSVLRGKKVFDPNLEVIVN